VKRELLQQLSQTLKGELRRSKRRTSTSIAVIIGLTIGVFVIDYSLREPDAPVPNPGTDLTCEVRHIYDGDTLTVGCDQGRLKVRVWGIDAPEKGQKPWGDDARNFLSHLISGKAIQVQVVDKDRYGRVVARLFLGEQDIGLSMIDKGKAIVYEQYNNSRTYRETQVIAQNQKRGIWSEPGAQQDPAGWRKMHARN
jgi:endonuclease YncB( thermonuclease family)